jgi:hypothetical protein
MMRHGIPLALLLSLSVGVSAAPAQLGPWVKDESNGFKFKGLAKWDQVPTKFQEVAVVGKWSGRSKRGSWEPECNVLRFLRKSGEGESGTPPNFGDGFPAGGMPGYESLFRFQPKDLWEYLERNWMLKGWDVEPDPGFRMSDKKLKAELRVYRQKGPPGRPEREYATSIGVIYAAQVEKADGTGDASFGVVYLCSKADEEQMESAFRRSISSFKVLDLSEAEELEEGESVSDDNIFVDSEQKPEEWRAARKKKLIAGWDAVDTKNYLIVFNKEVKPLLVKTIAKHIEAIRDQIYSKLFPPAREMKAISVVRVCKDPQEYHRYGGPGGSAGYWSRGDEELVFYQDKSNEKDSLRVLYHEAFHQYIHYAVGDVAPHSWFNEGHGDYFAGFDYKDGKFVSNVFRWRTGTISDALSTKSYVPLDQFLTYSQGQYYANAGLCYAQGWSLVYFLREVERRKLKQYQKYWGLLDKYFDAIKANVKEVKERGLGGLEVPVPPPEPSGEAPLEPEAVAPTPEAPHALVPGLEGSFPGENAAAGAPKRLEAAEGESETSAGPGKVASVEDALDAAVKRAFEGIDLAQLEKDWVEFSK